MGRLIPNRSMHVSEIAKVLRSSTSSDKTCGRLSSRLCPNPSGT